MAIVLIFNVDKKFKKNYIMIYYTLLYLSIKSLIFNKV